MVRNGNFMEIKETSRLQSPFMVNRDEVGYRVGLPMTAVGRTYLAFCPETERAEILAALRKTGHPADHPVKNLRDFHGVLETIRAQGYAMRDSSYQGGNYADGSFFDDGLNAIALALQGPDKVLGCINLLWVRQAVPSKQFVADNFDFDPRLQSETKLSVRFRSNSVRVYKKQNQSGISLCPTMRKKTTKPTQPAVRAFATFSSYHLCWHSSASA
ncbi:MAG: IclR family transcriptional regulator C-terminal domain-containing protein [Alphaproteobacteria bacterium]|nr:IclR family transcriptional regulator C-terminal domain-containing protein [Alphaproteobacteria bacterium]